MQILVVVAENRLLKLISLEAITGDLNIIFDRSLENKQKYRDFLDH